MASFILFLIVCVVLLFYVVYYIYLISFHVDAKSHISRYCLTPCPETKIDKKRIYILIDDLCVNDHEDITIESHDGLKLYARYYHKADRAPLTILFHGYRSAAERDFCGVFRLFRDLGHNILLVDERAHGGSEGRVITFGIKERIDCLSWMDYAEKRFGKDTRIFIAGMSMGSSTVLLA